MPGSGTTQFIDADDYQTSIRGAKFDLVFRSQKNFKARLTWVELHHLRLLRGQENLPRVAHVSLTSDLVFIAFPTRYDPPQIFDGVELQPGDIVFHSQGERVHQQTRGPSQWGFISLAPEYLAAGGKALAGFDLVPPPFGRILRPSPVDAAYLRRLHGAACRLAETKPKMLAHPEVARALEQDALHTIVNCLTSNNAHERSARLRRHMKIIARFEEVLAAHPERQLPIPELCAAIGVSEGTLRRCCLEFLGMNPNRYHRLQRLNALRAALRRVDTPTATVGELAGLHGFSELGRFAAIYRTVFGETPSATLRRVQITRQRLVSAEIA
jgi:AraC-like DNA-binding protein